MSDSLENARKFLESLQRTDLSKLISHSEIESGVSDDLWIEVVVRSPRPFSEALAALPPHDRKRIAEAVVSDEGNTSTPNDIVLRTMTGAPVEGLEALLPELIIHQEMMVAVSTGNGSIQDVNDYYIARQVRIADLCAGSGIKYENPHTDLWDWFRYYKEHFPSYAERRKYVRDLLRPAITASSVRSTSTVPPREPTGWDRVDRALAKARVQLGTASDVNRRGTLTPYRRPILTPRYVDQHLASPALAGVAEGGPSAGDDRLRL